MRVLVGHETAVTAVHFSPERWLLSADGNGQVLFRNMVDLTVEQTMWPGWGDVRSPRKAVARPVSSLLVTKDSRFLVAGYRPNGHPTGKWVIARWSLDTPGDFHAMASRVGEYPALAQSPDGSEIIAVHEPLTTQYWSRKPILTWKVPGWSRSQRFAWGAPIGRAHVDITGQRTVCAGVKSGEVWLDMPGRPLNPLNWEAHPTSVRGVILVPGQSQMITAGPNQVRLWDLDAIEKQAYPWGGSFFGTVAPLREWFRSGSQYITCIALSPDGRTLVVGRNGGIVNLLEAESLQERMTFRWPIGNVTCLTFAPDGLRAAVGGEKGTVVVWDLE